MLPLRKSGTSAKIRTFSEAEITQTKHGPEAEKLYTRVQSECGPVGAGAMGLGLALGALAIASFSRDEKPPEASHLTIAPLRAGATVGWAGRF